MLNRRSSLVNLVTLQITSNVSGTIIIDGESFSGTSASKKIRQGKEVTWSVSANEYVTKSSTVVMSSNKELSVSLDPSIVTFTITSNVNATITINGDASTGVTTKSVSVSPGSSVTWSVSASEYTTQSGSEVVNINTTKSISLVFNGVTSQCKTGYIWCTDGSFVDPSMYQSSGKEAYGYTLSSSTVVSLTRSGYTMVWASSGSKFYATNFTGAQSLTDGVANSNYLKAQSYYSSNYYTGCPAVYYGCTQTNGGKTSYMPARDELLTLYDSIMSGSMKTDLTTAGIYESCNYRLSISGSNSSTSGNWHIIWSSSQHSNASDYALLVHYDRGQYSDHKDNSESYVIPFFHFS